MTTRLATPDDLTRRMGITVESERALALLADASAAVISYTGQQFVRATTTVQVRVPSDWKVRLGQLPVHDVDAVRGREPGEETGVGQDHQAHRHGAQAIESGIVRDGSVPLHDGCVCARVGACACIHER